MVGQVFESNWCVEKVTFKMVLSEDGDERQNVSVLVKQRDLVYER